MRPLSTQNQCQAFLLLCSSFLQLPFASAAAFVRTSPVAPPSPQLQPLHARADDNSLCGNGRVPLTATRYGTVSVAIPVVGADEEVVQWTVMVDALPSTTHNPTFYFASPVSMLESSTNQSNSSCTFKAATGVSIASLNGNGTDACSQSIGSQCAGRLQPLSASLRRVTAAEAGDSVGFVCMVDQQSKTAIGVSECDVVANSAAPAATTPYGYDRSLVLGPVLGGLGLVIAIIAAFLLVRRRRKRREKKDSRVAGGLYESQETVFIMGGGPSDAGARPKIIPLGQPMMMEIDSGFESEWEPEPAITRESRPKASPVQDMRPVSSNPSDIGSDHSRAVLLGQREPAMRHDSHSTLT